MYKNHPVTSAYIQLQSHTIEVYKTNLKIHAHFTGLRFIMFNYPVVSAFMGISTNLFFLSIIAFLSWYKFFTPKQVVYHVGYDSKKAQTLEERRVLAKQRLMRESERRIYSQTLTFIHVIPAFMLEVLKSLLFNSCFRRESNFKST